MMAAFGFVPQSTAVKEDYYTNSLKGRVIKPSTLRGLQILTRLANIISFGL